MLSSSWKLDIFESKWYILKNSLLRIKVYISNFQHWFVQYEKQKLRENIDILVILVFNLQNHKIPFWKYILVILKIIKYSFISIL